MKISFNSSMFVAVVLCLVLASGCSNEKAATEANFSSAISTFLETDPACVFLNLGSLPGELSADSTANSSSDYLTSSSPKTRKIVTVEDFSARNAVAAALASSGLVTLTIAQREAEPYEGAKRTELRSFAQVTVTDKGKPFYQIARGPLGRAAAFCFAKKQLVTIDNFTEPSDMMGQKVSRVAYTWELDDIAEWAGGDVSSADPQVAMTLDKVGKPQSGRAVLVLTNKGWVHEKLFAPNN